MRDSLPMIVCSEGIAERLQRLHQHEAAWREVAWSGVVTHKHEAVHEFPVAISGGVLAFLVLVEYPDHREFEYLLHLFRVPSKLRGVPSESWELPLSGLGKLLDIAIDSAQDLLLLLRCGLEFPWLYVCDTVNTGIQIQVTIYTYYRCRLEKSTLRSFTLARLVWG
jgi:hypothetical protein